MRLSNTEALILLLCVTAGMLLCRGLPFVLFPENKRRPKIITYLSTTIPAAVMGLLVVHCLKGVTVLAYPYGIPELMGVAVTAALHLWRRSMLLSIAGGTAVYMLLVQMVFV